MSEHRRRTTDLAVRVMIAFSISPDSLGVLDSLRTYLSGISTLDTEPSPAARSGLSLAAWPNPVRGAMALSWSLPAAGAARLALYDVSGRRVALLHEGAAGSGAHVTRWNGRDADGRVSPPGIYLARLETAAGVRSVRVVRVR